MSTSPESRRQHPSTYAVRDSSRQEELTRLEIQDKLVTASMGGVLAEQADPASLKKVLDMTHPKCYSSAKMSST
ncbi:MAG: hypothetical protein PVS3B1_14710 [Ktedonobacteraceae bacterium]